MNYLQRISSLICLMIFLSTTLAAQAEDNPELEFGFSKLDVIPETPIRLSGYNERSTPYEGVQDVIYVRTMVIRQKDGNLHALCALESIGFPGELTTKISRQLEKKFSIPRHRFVLSSTHTHAGPQVQGFAPNLYREELTKEEVANIKKYNLFLEKRIVEGVEKAIADLSPGKLTFGQGKVGFAGNRRKLKNGKCVAMAFNPEGVVDHSVPILKILGTDGKVRGIVFNYACHCVTLTGKFNKITGDWAGLASEYLEDINPGATALCTIGCGADANTEPRGTYEMAVGHGRTMSTEVKRVIAEKLEPISGKLKSSFGFAGLPVNFPPMSKFELDLKSSNIHVKRRAEFMKETFARKGRLPESYPMPVQIWSFGDDLKMVFLGGEVVADYAVRLKKELKAKHIWVTAYANDVFGYVPSERMIEEGGYEVEYSMLFYNHPGPWKSGTEEIIFKRVHEIDQAKNQEIALSAEEALKTFQVPDGLEIELVASEPLIVDPVNFSFGIDGKLWVTQMSDYPTGDAEGKPSGVVKFLEDTDQDGKFDKATVFLEKIDYPTGAIPWKKGVLISSATKIIYAEDQNGDGHADTQEVLYSGFDPSNAQHLINGFIYGLDHWLYLGSGTYQRKIKAEKTGKTVDASGRDMKIQPDSGDIELISGLTQYGRARNDWGDWFGNSNSEPLFHFVISDHYLRRNPYYPGIKPKVYVTPIADRIYPSSRVIARFNELHSVNRFTSACSPLIFRDVTLGKEFEGMGLTCEPVHNLVGRRLLERDGIPFRGKRFPDDQKKEFIRSTDTWSRPVRVETGPDGALWMADMYRLVIEHPQWIPDEWQKQLDLKAGEDKGRIYRIYKKGNRPGPLPQLSKLSNKKMVQKLATENGTIRDLVQKTLINKGDLSVVPDLESMTKTHTDSKARLHALCTLNGLNQLKTEVLVAGLNDQDWRVQRISLKLSEKRIEQEALIQEAVLKLVDHPVIQLQYQLALSLGEWNSPKSGVALGKIAVKHYDNKWMQSAILCSSLNHSDSILTHLFNNPDTKPSWSGLVSHLIVTNLGKNDNHSIVSILGKITGNSQTEVQPWQISAMISFLDALSRKNISLQSLNQSASPELKKLINKCEPIFQTARNISLNDKLTISERVMSLSLLGQGPSKHEEDLKTLAEFLSAQISPKLQSEAVRTFGKISNKNIPELLLENWRGYSSGLQGEILTILSRRTNWTLKLLDYLEAGDVLAVDIDAASRARLLKSRTEKISQRAKTIFKSIGSEDRKKIIKEYETVLSQKGNFIRGSILFKKHCTACHKFRERGNEFGANLAVLSDKSSGNLLTSILDPNRAVEKKFLNYQIQTKNGKIYSGMSLDTSSTSITLANPDGKKETILRTDIEEYLNTGKSFMPEGLEKDLSKEDIADIIAFIQSNPIPTRSINLELVQEMKGQLEVAGNNGMGQLLTGHAKKKLKTWLGEIEVIYCSAEQPGSKIIWNTQPVSTVIKPKSSQLFRLPVVMGGFEDQTKSNFVLKVNDKAQVHLTTSKADAFWKSEDSQYQIQLTVVQTGPDYTSGFFEISIPVSVISLGKPIKLSFEAESSGQSWLGIIPL